jgi:uncharacterized protein YdaU (DUF1376 family)
MKPTGEYPFVNFEVKQFIGREGVDLLPLEGMGLLFRCMLRAWREGSVPSSHAALARLVGATEEQIDGLLPSLSTFYEEHEGRLIFPLVEGERVRVTKLIEDNTAKGHASAIKRAENKKHRAEIARNARERKKLNSGSNAVDTAVPPTITRSIPIPIPEPSLTTFPKTETNSAKIQAPSGTAWKSIGNVVEKMIIPGVREETGNGNGDFERFAQGLFFDLWPQGPYEWDTQRQPLIEQIEIFGKGNFNFALGKLKDKRRAGEPIIDEMRYLCGTAKAEYNKRKLCTKQKAAV